VSGQCVGGSQVRLRSPRNESGQDATLIPVSVASSCRLFPTFGLRPSAIRLRGFVFLMGSSSSRGTRACGCFFSSLLQFRRVTAFDRALGRFSCEHAWTVWCFHAPPSTGYLCGWGSGGHDGTHVSQLARVDGSEREQPVRREFGPTYPWVQTPAVWGDSTDTLPRPLFTFMAAGFARVSGCAPFRQHLPERST